MNSSNQTELVERFVGSYSALKNGFMESARLAALDEMNAIIRAASGSDLCRIAAASPWGKGPKETLRNLAARRRILTALAEGREKIRR